MRSNEIANFVRNIPNGRMVGIEWVKADGSIRRGSCTFGVQNPTHVTKPGQGVRKGVTFTEALEKGTLKFFDVNADNGDGTKGGYRSAKLNRITKITYNGETHLIEDNQHLIG
jgi:hypothetical protein